MGTSKTLVLLRHAQAVPHGSAPDFDRRLTDAGRRDAARAGERLADLALQAILCSPSARTRETLDAVLAARRAPSPDPDFDPCIYDAEADDLLELLGGLDAADHGVLLVGHNPSISRLVSELADPASSGGFDGLATGAFARLAVAAPWRALKRRAARLVEHHAP